MLQITVFDSVWLMFNTICFPCYDENKDQHELYSAEFSEKCNH